MDWSSDFIICWNIDPQGTIPVYMYTCVCGCFCTCVPACVRTACLKRALRWWPSSRQMDHEALGKNLMSCLWPSPRQVHEG